MSCLGVHFALSADDLAKLLASDGAPEQLAFLLQALECSYLVKPATYAAASDKSWDAMNHAFSGGQWEGGHFPLNHVVFGGRALDAADGYMRSLKSSEQVVAIAAAIEHITTDEFRRLYDAIDADSYEGDIGDEDFEYTWQWFQGVRDLYLLAAAEGRAVLFSAGT